METYTVKDTGTTLELVGTNFYIRHSPKEKLFSVDGDGSAEIVDQDYTGEARVIEISASGKLEEYLFVWSVTWSDGKTYSLRGVEVPTIKIRESLTLDEKKNADYCALRDKKTAGLTNSGGYWNRAPLAGVEFKTIAVSAYSRGFGSELEVGEHPVFGTIYRERFGNVCSLLAPLALIEECYLVYSEQQYFGPGFSKNPGPVSPEDSYEWLKKYGRNSWREIPATDEISARGCVGQEFHEWNARRGGYSPRA